MPRTLLVVGHGPGFRRTLAAAGRLTLRTVAASPAGTAADGADEVVRLSPSDAADVEATAREQQADGVLAASPEAALAVAGAAAALGLPGPGADAAETLAGRIALRRRLADAGVPQPSFAAVRTLHEARAALGAVGLPARLLPAETWIAGGRFELASREQLDASLHRALAASPTEEAVLEGAPPGTLVEALVACRGGRARVLVLADRLTADTFVHPSALFGDAAGAAERAAVHTARAVGVADGLTAVTVAADGPSPRVVDARPWAPSEPLDALARHATGTDPLELAIRLALGVRIRVDARFQRAVALRLVDPERAAAVPGVVELGDGFVVGAAETNLAAHELVAAIP